MNIKYTVPSLALVFSFSNATTIKDIVNYTIENNPDIASKNYNNKAFRKYIDEKRGGYYPKLDLTAYLEKKKTKQNPGNDENLKGGNAQLDLEQLIYDGNLTSSLVGEAKSNYLSNEYKNLNDVENIIYDSISAYLNILKFEDRIIASKNNLSIHDNYLSIANETEKINGEILDKVQTKAKIHSAKSNLYSEESNKNAAISSFKRNVGMQLDGSNCEPIIDESLLPLSLDELYKLALKSNYSILEQIKSIDSQKEVVSQSKSAFLPTLKLKLQAIYDKDLIEDDVKTKEYNGRIELKYNIFNGLIDKAKTDKDKLFLKEAQAKLDVVTKKVIDELTVAYNKYNTSKKQALELEQFINENRQIIEIYKDQFDAGTRNFIDVLNVESDLFNSQLSYVNAKYSKYLAYYEIQKLLSNLQNNILSSEDTSCVQANVSKKLEENSVQKLLEENAE